MNASFNTMVSKSSTPNVKSKCDINIHCAKATKNHDNDRYSIQIFGDGVFS